MSQKVNGYTYCNYLKKQYKITNKQHSYSQPKSAQKMNEQNYPIKVQKQLKLQCQLMKRLKVKLQKDSRNQNAFTKYQNPFTKYQNMQMKQKKQCLEINDIRNFKIIGQFDNKIFVGWNQILGLLGYFDQHAIHQRIRYQYYLDCLNNYQQPSKMRQWDTKYIQKVGEPLLIISKIKNCYIKLKVHPFITKSRSSTININKWGFNVQYNHQESLLKIRTYPQILQRPLHEKLVINIVQELLIDDKVVPKCLDKSIAEISCKSAFKFNDQLTKQHIDNLIQNLAICKFPFFCVHGRPTLFLKT